MKKNLLSILVVLFVIFACALVIKEINSGHNPQLETQQYYADSDLE